MSSENSKDPVIQRIDSVKTYADSIKFIKPEEALKYYKRLLFLADKNNENEVVITALNRIGAVNYTQGKYNFALEFYLRALNKSEELGYSRGIAVGYNNIALIYAMQDRYKQAIEYHGKSIKICKQKNYDRLLGKNYMNIGIAYEMSGNYDNAELYLNKAIEVFNEAGYPDEAIRIYNHLGNVFLAEETYSYALKMFQLVTQEDDYKNLWEICFAEAGLAKTFLKLGEYDLAEKHGLKSYSIAEELDVKWDLQNITGALSEIYERQGDFENAFRFQRLFKAYSDSVFNSVKEEQINFLKLKRAEIEKENLKQENKAKQKMIEMRENQLLLFIAGLVLLVAVIFLLLRNVIIQNRLYKVLNKKNSEIDKKNNDLTNLNATKDTLFRIIAHDLRSPMGVMMSFTDLIIENYDEFDRDTILDFISKLNKSSREGFELLENLLEWAKSQTGGISLEPVNLNVKDIVNSVKDSLMSVSIEKKVIISQDVDKDLTLFTDKNMLTIILRNLISNAIKFSNPGGKVFVSVRRTGNMMSFSVKDHGIGISEENIKKLYQIDKYFTTRGTQNEKGTGLGLIICKDFVERLGGNIDIISSEGSGTDVKFNLPYRKSQ